jgi:general secretion pathway protein H
MERGGRAMLVDSSLSGTGKRMMRTVDQQPESKKPMRRPRADAPLIFVITPAVCDGSFLHCGHRLPLTGFRLGIPNTGGRFARQRASCGFTLIEILVVVVILAVLAATVSLAISGAGGERQLLHEAERAQALITYACERAELTGRAIGLSFDDEGYRFSQFEHDMWKPYRVDELRAREWPVNVSALITRDGRKVDVGKDFPTTPQLLCYASGELTPFRADLVLPDLARYYRLDGQLDGHVTLAVVDIRAK